MDYVILPDYHTIFTLVRLVFCKLFTVDTSVSLYVGNVALVGMP